MEKRATGILEEEHHLIQKVVDSMAVIGGILRAWGEKRFSGVRKASARNIDLTIRRQKNDKGAMGKQG